LAEVCRALDRAEDVLVREIVRTMEEAPEKVLVLVPAFDALAKVSSLKEMLRCPVG